MKSLFKFIFFLVVISLGYFAYTLWSKGELTKEGLTKNYNTYKEKGLKESLGDLKNELTTLSTQAQSQWNAIDWNDIGSKFNLSKNDLLEYKKSIKWLHKEENAIVIEKEGTPDTKVAKKEIIKETPKTTVSIPTKKETTNIAKKEPRKIKKTAPAKTPKKQTKKGSGSKYFHDGMALVKKAKAEGRLGIPGKPNFKKHLNNSAKIYKKCLAKFKKAKRDSKCTKEQKKKIHELESVIASQIYWAKKLGSI